MKSFDSLLSLVAPPRRWLVPSLIALLLVAGGLLQSVVAQPPLTIYVDVDAAGADDGTSWDDAYVHLQDAFDQASAAADATVEIWIAAGVYYPDLDADGDHVPGSRSESFSLARDGVQLYGGFDPGSGVVEFDQRDPATYLTVLSGDVDRDDADGDGNGIAETWEDIQGANAYHVLYLDGRDPHPITDQTVLDGIVITAGQADVAFDEEEGGGLLCQGEGYEGPALCSPRLSGVVVSGNQAIDGGGIYNDGAGGGDSSPTLDGVTLSGNLATRGGGGMFNNAFQGIAAPILTGVTFDGNKAAGGGGMSSQGTSNGSSSGAILTDVLFENNEATGSGGGMSVSGTSPMLRRVTFRANVAGSEGFTSADGGGLFTDGIIYHGSPVLIDVVFDRNRAARGGGLATGTGQGGIVNLDLIGVVFQGNVATAHGGGGMRLSAGEGAVTATLTNILFSGNQATGDGGALYNLNNTALYATLTNVTFSNNVAGGSGGGIANDRTPLLEYLEMTLTNGVLWGNEAAAGGAQIHDPEGMPTVTVSLIQGGFPTGTAIIDADPLFRRHPDPGADGTWGTGDDDYGDLHLRATSPAVDAGDDVALPADTYDLDDDGDTTEPLPIDLDGRARFVGAVDMGAYEAAGAELAIDKLAPVVQALPGEAITYTLTFTNHGPLTATGVLVTDIVPLDHLSDVSYQATLPVTPAGGADYTWQVASLMPGARGTITLTAVLTHCPAGGMELLNTVSIGSEAMDDEVGNNEDTVLVTALNAAPIAHADTYTASGRVLRVTADAGVLSNDTDANCDPLSTVLIDDVATGTLRLDAAGSLVYTAPVGFEGTVSFAYQAADGEAVSPPVMSQITILQVMYHYYLPLVARP